MLSFILSKMNMMVFATGVFIVVFLFLSFITSTGETREALSLLQNQAKVIEEQINVGSLCSLKAQSIPDTLRKGIGADYLFYEMIFSKISLGEGKNVLQLSISERGKKNIIASQSVYTFADIILIDPEYLKESEPVDNYYNTQDVIKLFPRGETAPNSYIVIKEVFEGKESIYIVPFTSYQQQSRSQGIVKVGCYLLKKRNPIAADNTLIPSCFNVSLELTQTSGSTNMNITKAECKNILGESYFIK